MISYLYIFLLIITIYTSYTLAVIPDSKCPEEDALRKCLNQLAFVRPTDVLDVQKVIKCAAKLHFPIVARSGGHSYEGYGIGDKDCYLVVDLVTLNKTTIDITSQTAVIGTGNVLESLYYNVNQHIFAFPAGTCPYVGVGGLMLGGGMGYLNRKFGLSSDNILDAQIVLANGTIVHSARKHPELYWAIRGAGNAGYGIVTTLTLKIHPIQKIVTSMFLDYDFDQTPLLLSVMNKLGNNLHRNLTILFNIDSNSTHIHGIYLGSTSELQSHMQEFIKLSKPNNVTYSENDLYNSLTKGTEGSKIKDSYKVKSYFIDSKGLSDEGIKSLMSFIKNFECEIYSVMLLIGGGKVNEIKRKETAFVHRGFLYHMEVKVTAPTEMCLQKLDSFSQQFQRNYTHYESYQNLADRQLNNWQHRYFGENFKKLVTIKRKYDPHNLFHWNQMISLAEKWLHEYPIKPEIEYKNLTTGTYHYIILSEGHYPPSPILAKSQKKNNNCYRIPDKYKAKVSWGKKSKWREIICSIDYKNQDNDKEDNPTNKKPCFKIEFNNGLQVVESWKSATDAANIYSQIYNPKGTSILSGTIVFGLQLKCVEHNRDLYHQARVFKPIETYSNPTKRARLEQI
ncbi:2381_t:CDS:2, partial [Cetraspora pellucida]